MNGRLESIRDKVRVSADGGLRAELRYLLDRVLRRDQIIGSLAPDQWKSIASRVPPGHRQEREALSRIARLAEELQEEEEEEAAAADGEQARSGDLVAGD